MRARPGAGILAGVTASPSALLVPPVRLGRLLHDAREAHSESLETLARRSGLAFDEEWFARLEAGQVPLDEQLVRWVGDLYGVRAGEIVPARSQLVIDLDEGAISIGNRRSPLVGAPEALTSSDQVLGNYLALVYLLRDLPPGTPIPIREFDVAVLAQALQRDARDVRTALGRLVASNGDALAGRSASLRRRLIVPVAGILVGLTAVGGLLLVRSTSSEAQNRDVPVTQEDPTSTAREVPVDIGDAVVIERDGAQTTR
jgi:transcriptional regulator with XRE-family HTH domain